MLAGGCCAWLALGEPTLPRVTYTKSFPARDPAYVAITVERDGAATYKEAKDDDPETFKLEPDACRRSSIWPKSWIISSIPRIRPEGRQHGREDVSLGRRRGTRAKSKFNYSPDDNAKPLLDWFERITETERAHAGPAPRRPPRQAGRERCRAAHADGLGSQSGWWDAEQFCRCSIGSPRTNLTFTWRASGPRALADAHPGRRRKVRQAE